MKIKSKKLLSLSLVATLLLGFVGCQSSNNTTKEETAATEATTKIIVDHAGAEVEIPTEVNRVVVSNPVPLTSVLTVYLGGAEKIVGLHPTAMSAAANGLLGEIYPELLNAETGFINGLTTILTLLILNIITLNFKINITTILYYLIIIFISILGSIIGINKKR